MDRDNYFKERTTSGKEMENQAANDDFLTEEKMEEIRNEIESKDI